MDSPKDLIIKLIQSRESTPLPHLLDGHISSSSSQTASPVLVDQLEKLSPIQPRRERVSSPFDSNGPRPSQRERVLEEFEDDEDGESSFEAFGGVEMEEESQ